MPYTTTYTYNLIPIIFDDYYRINQKVFDLLTYLGGKSGSVEKRIGAQFLYNLAQNHPLKLSVCDIWHKRVDKISYNHIDTFDSNWSQWVPHLSRLWH